jgi:hypothetical protein
MAKKLIVLETNTNDGGQFTVRVAFWFPIIASKRVPIPALTKSSWTGANATEVQALADGSYIEEVKQYSFAASETTANIKIFLAKAWTDRKAYLDTLPYIGQYYGVYLDDVNVWSN